MGEIYGRIVVVVSLYLVSMGELSSPSGVGSLSCRGYHWGWVEER